MGGMRRNGRRCTGHSHFVGMGTDELSMAPQWTPSVKQAIRNWSIKDARELTIQFLMLDSAEEIRMVVGESIAKMPR